MIQHYRGEEFIQKIEPVSAQLKRALMGPFLLEVEVADITNLVVGDLLKIEHLNETFTFRIREIKERQITAEHISYVLQNYAVVDKYFNNPPTYDDFIEFADVKLNDILNGFLAPLLNDAGFTVINNSNSADTKDITFQSDNLLSAIQKIADTFKVEFIQHDTYIEFVDQVGADRGITINAGVESDKVIKKIDRSHIVTRVYPLGSSENLPDGYYYTNLKPTTFDLATKTHSGNVYVDNDTAINTYGVIEKVVEFSDIKIQSRRGTVDSAGEDYLSEYDRTYPYIYDPALSDIDESKALSATLFIVDGLKAAELRIIKASASEKRIYYSKTLKDGSELGWAPSSGARYILVGYISQTEIDEARDKLIQAAQDYLNEHSAPKITYEIQKIYLGDYDFEIGDSLGIKDDSQGIDDTVRVIEYTKDLIKNVYNSLKFSNVLEKIPYEFLKEQYEQKQRLKKISSAVSNSVQTAREALERHNLLVRNNFYGSENEYILIGSEARNYALKGLTITPDDGATGKISWTDFEFQEILSNTPYQCGEGSVQLSEGTYYIFIQIQANDFANSGGQNKLVFSQTKLENSGSLIYYALGMAEFDGTRTKVGTSYGFTLIDGNFIKTGTIDADKLNVGITPDKLYEVLAERRVKKLLIWYAYPSGINNTFDNTKTAQIFSSYDLVVFPEDLEQETHEDHANGVEIIRKIKELNPKTLIFGYIPTGRLGADKCYSVATIQAKAQAWKDMGVDGIFLDEFGYDYNNDRTRQNAILDAVHNLGLIAFVNAWNPDDVFGGTPEIHWDVGKDWYLLESFGTVADGTNVNWVHSSNVFYRAWQVKFQYSSFNINVAAVSTVNDNADGFADRVNKIMHVLSTAYGIDAVAVEKYFYYSSDPVLLNLQKLPIFDANYKGGAEPSFESGISYSLSDGTVLSNCERRYGSSPVGDYDIVWDNNNYEPVYVYLSNFYEYEKIKGDLDLYDNISTILQKITGNNYTEIDGGVITTGVIKGHFGTTEINLDKDKITVGTDLVKIGKGVLTNGGNGIMIKGSNLEIIGGQIKGVDDTTILDLDNDLIIVNSQPIAITEAYLNVKWRAGGVFQGATIQYSLDGTNWYTNTEAIPDDSQWGDCPEDPYFPCVNVLLDLSDKNASHLYFRFSPTGTIAGLFIFSYYINGVLYYEKKLDTSETGGAIPDMDFEIGSGFMRIGKEAVGTGENGIYGLQSSIKLEGGGYTATITPSSIQVGSYIIVGTGYNTRIFGYDGIGFYQDDTKVSYINAHADGTIVVGPNGLTLPTVGSLPSSAPDGTLVFYNNNLYLRKNGSWVQK